MLFIIYHEPTKNTLSCSFFESTSTREDAIKELENDGRPVVEVIEFPQREEEKVNFTSAEGMIKNLLEQDYSIFDKHSPIRFMEKLILQAYKLGQVGKHNNSN